MKLPSLKTVLLTPIIAFVVFYIVAALVVQTRDVQMLSELQRSSESLEVAMFGASGTAGDGILKAALASEDVAKIHIITRRVTPRIQAGMASGKAKVWLHQDYLDYSEIINEISNVDAVFWAIGISSLGADEKTYGMIHVDFPVQFVKAWSGVSHNAKRSFHFISSSDISESSSTMWVREKIRAEKALFQLGEETDLRVVAYRPDYIGATDEQASILQNLLYRFFRPVGAAVKATEIGQAMIDVTLRETELVNGMKLNTSKIVLHGK